MKSILIVSLFLSNSLIAQLDFRWCYPTTSPNTMDTYHVLSDSIIVIFDRGVIVKTEDQGLNWTKNYCFLSQVDTISTIFFHAFHVDEDGNCLIIAKGKNSVNHTLYKSEDWGVSWQIVGSHPYFNTSNEIFRRNNKVWLFGPENTGSLKILISDNGGESFIEGNGTFQHPLSKEGRKLYFVDSLTGYLLTNRSEIMKTMDGGYNWTTINIDTTNGFKTFYYDLHVVEDGELWVTGMILDQNGQKHHMLLYTNDDCQNFVDRSIPGLGRGVEVSELNGKLYCGALSPNSVFSYMYTSEDEGVSWDQELIAAGGNVHDIRRIKTGTNTVWLNNSEGSLMVQHLNENSWNEISRSYSNASVSFTDVFVREDDQIFVTTDAGYILKSTDAGNTWNEQFLPCEKKMTSVYFYDHLNGWILLETDSLFKTNDGGISWTKTKTQGTSDKTLNKITFTSPNNGHILGDFGWYFRTDDGGLNWQSISLPSTINPSVNDMNFIDQSNGWICGENGYLVRTSDGGSTWEDLSTWIPGRDYQSISFVDTSVGWTIADSIYKTINGGSTWFSQGYNYQYAESKVFALSYDSVYRTDSYILQYSFDSGNNWIENQDLLSDFHKAIHFNKSGLGVLIGDLAIFKTSPPVYCNPLTSHNVLANPNNTRKIKITQNPCRKSCVLERADAGSFHMNIYNIAGKKLYSNYFKDSDQRFIIPDDEINSSILFIETISNDHHDVQKLLLIN